jgi:hypothetical protein
MGEPSASILKDAQRVLDFIEDERHLTALKLYESVKSRIDTWDGTRKKRASTRNPNKGGFSLGRGARSASSDSTQEDADYSDAKAFLQGKQRKIVKLQVRSDGLDDFLTVHCTSRFYAEADEPCFDPFHQSLESLSYF